MPKDKDLKRLVRARMSETSEPYTTARLVIMSANATEPDRLRELRDLVEQLGDKSRRIEAMRALMGGVTATELQKIEAIPQDVFDALVEGLRNPMPPVRWWCVQLLDHVADERAIQAVAVLLDDPVDRVRRNAVHALGCVACKPTADPALPDELLSRISDLATNDPSAKVRREALHALACRLDADSHSNQT